MQLENIYKNWWGQQSAKEVSNQQKIYILSCLPGYGEFKNFCFVSVAWTVSVSRAFIYNAINVNKIAATFLAKLPP